MSSTNESDLASPFIAIDRPSAASRTRPDRRLRRSVDRAMVAIAEAARGQIALERVEPRRQVVGAVVVELHAEQRRRVALDERPPQPFERRALLRVIEDEAIHHLDRRRTVRQDRRASPRAPRADRRTGSRSTALAFGSGTSSIFASTTTPSVPSEPTISFARLKG